MYYNNIIFTRSTVRVYRRHLISRCNYVSIETLRYSPLAVIIHSTNKSGKKYAFFPVAIKIAHFKSYKYADTLLTVLPGAAKQCTAYIPTNLTVTTSYPPIQRSCTD